MAKKTITAKQNIWFNSQQVDEDNLTLEQNYNNSTQSSLISNHIGTGGLPDTLSQLVLFDSLLVSGTIDGTPLTVQNQPSDNVYGNQLELELTKSKVFGRRSIKVVILGTAFDDSLIYETFTFNRNEIQVGEKHFKTIVSILINDMFGPQDKSFNLGGQLLIKEAKLANLSRSTLLIAENSQPNLFWRDFFPVSTLTLNSLLLAALPGFNLDSLNISVSEKNIRSIEKNDITTEYGQKCQILSNNIQKIRLLLGVQNTDPGNEADLQWNGNVVITIYPLQSTVSCITDLAPNLEIDFDPINTPIAQLTFSYSSLLSDGVQLSNTLQPVDFVFSNSSAANGKTIENGKYYVFSIKRSGTADKCDILIGTGDNTLTNSRMSIYNGVLWTDVQDESMWFELYSDSAKVSSAKIYEDGFGIEIAKTVETDSVVQDYSLKNLSFYGSNEFTGIVYSGTEESEKVEDLRTGSTIDSIQQKVPKVELLSQLEIDALESTKSLLKIGKIVDKNRKFVPNNTITSHLRTWSIINNEIIIPIIDDATDTSRYDSSILTLSSSIANGELFLAKITPNSGGTLYYRIGDAELLTMIYGDVNGDCKIDEDDLDLLNFYSGFNLNSSPPLYSNLTSDGYFTTAENGYVFLTNKSVTASALHFQVVQNIDNAVIADGYDGVLVVNSNTLSSFASTIIDFSSITNLSECSLVVFDSSNLENYGSFKIEGINLTSDVLTISKKYIDQDIYLSLLRANIDGDFYIGPNDGYILDNFLSRNRLTSFSSTIYPAPTSNHYDKIGKNFQVLKLKLEQFIDREDDYYSSDRNNTLHQIQDIFGSDGYFQSHDYLNFPVSILIEPRLSWKNYLVVYSSDIKLVPNTIVYDSGFNKYECEKECNAPYIYPAKPSYDKGRVDCFVPNNIVIGDGGQLLNVDSSYHKIDFEVGTIILEIPDNFYGNENSINVFDSFVSNYQSTGRTRLGFPAMKFADCSYVESDAISRFQIKFSVAVQSFSPNLDGYDVNNEYGIIVDGKMGVYIDHDTGILKLNFTNLFKDPLKLTVSTKLQINVFLKKGGFNNQIVSINKDVVNNLFL